MFCGWLDTTACTYRPTCLSKHRQCGGGCGGPPIWANPYLSEDSKKWYECRSGRVSGSVRLGLGRAYLQTHSSQGGPLSQKTHQRCCRGLGMLEEPIRSDNKAAEESLKMRSRSEQHLCISSAVSGAAPRCIPVAVGPFRTRSLDEFGYLRDCPSEFSHVIFLLY